MCYLQKTGVNFTQISVKFKEILCSHSLNLYELSKYNKLFFSATRMRSFLHCKRNFCYLPVNVPFSLL